MEKSIETIWKEGFLNKDDLVAPKINELYNQKSKHIVDKMTRMFSVNLIAILIGAAVLLVGFILIGAPVTGGLIFLLFAGLVLFSSREKEKIRDLDKNVNSYEYLKAFDNWLNRVIMTYTTIYRIFYPAFFLAFMIGLWTSSVGEKMISKFISAYPDTYTLFGVPLYWLIGALLFASALAVFAGKIYQFDIKLVYGPVIKKLHEIIADIEELAN